jgi:hypothetical protein
MDDRTKYDSRSRRPHQRLLIFSGKIGALTNEESEIDFKQFK